MNPRPLASLLGVTLLLVVSACGDDSPVTGTIGYPTPAGPSSGAGGATSSGAGGSGGDPTGGGGGESALPCATRITYGDAWIHGGDHPNDYDDAAGLVTWNGTCTDEGSNSFAVLSNGWKPYFTGHDACLMALDTTCAGAPACTTRITYGPAWLAAPNHPNSYDDVPGRVFWDRACTNSGADSFASLSNGWAPHFKGNNACEMSFEYINCGGLYDNPVFPQDCADPGVIRDGNQYLAVCTSGGAANAFPIRASTDLVHWSAKGHVFPSAGKPTWAVGDFWAPEIHKVGSQYLAYYTARHQDGRLSIGAATANTAQGPFTDIGQPLVHDGAMGMIDATHFTAADGTHYLVWKADGNAVGKPTPIYGQALSADGKALVGGRVTLMTNDLAWEGGVVEAPWVVRKDGMYYLFYSGNAYYNGTYAVGVARASSPLGPYTKAGAPILKTTSAWVGPGHCSVIDTPAGNSYMVYHAWQAGHVNGPGDGRLLLVDAIVWSGGWPAVPEAPSLGSRPMP